MNFIKTATCLLLIVGCQELFAHSQELVAGIIKLKSAVVIDHDLITMGDIAELEDLDAQFTNQLAQVAISPAPAAGQKTVITHDLVRRQLTARGWNLSTLLIQGSSQVQVSRVDATAKNMAALNEHQQQQVTQQLTQAIQTYYAQAGTEWATSQVQLQMSPETAVALLRCSPNQWQLQGPAPSYNQMFLMSVSYAGNNQQLEQAHIQVLLQPVPKVLGVKNTIPKGYLIQERDLIYVSTTKPQQGITDPKLIVGHESLRNIRAEEPIEPTFLRRNPLVRNQDIVTVYVKSPSFSIQRQFKAKSEGAMGDTIQLVTLDNKELISARVTGFREAEVIPTGAADITPIPQGQQISLLPATSPSPNNIQPIGYSQQISQVPFQRYQRSIPSTTTLNQPVQHAVSKPTVTSNQPLSLSR